MTVARDNPVIGEPTIIEPLFHEYQACCRTPL